MTNPQFTGVHPATDPVEVLAGSKRLNTDWALRYATVLETRSTITASGRYDGDVDKTVSLISLVGPLTAQQRVAVIFIPPSGNYVIGVISDADHMGPQASTENTAYNSSSITYTSVGAPAVDPVSLVIRVPGSGAVLLNYGAFMAVGTSGHAAYITIEIREGDVVGSGNLVIPASDDDAVIVANTAGNPDRQGVAYLFNGGVVGRVYNVQLLHRTTGAAGTFDSRYLIATTA